jgi:hypothetical protein
MRKRVLIVSAGLLVLIALVGLVVNNRSSHAAQEFSQTQLVAMVQSNLVAKLHVYNPPEPGQVAGIPVMLHEVRGTFYQTDADAHIIMAQGTPKELPFFARVHLTSELEQKFMATKHFAVVTPNPLVETVSHWLRRSK